MTRVTATLLCLLLATATLLPGAVRGEDEDTSSSAYLVFDPETGEFITVNDPNRSNQHAVIDESIDSLAAAGGRESRPAVIVGSAIAALLLAGAIGWLRRRQRG